MRIENKTCGKNYTLHLLLALLLFAAFTSGAFGQTTPQNKVFDLDAADRVKTSNTAVLDGKTFTVYQSKNGRLYFETGKLTKTGKAQRKYLTAAPKKD